MPCGQDHRFSYALASPWISRRTLRPSNLGTDGASGLTQLVERRKRTEGNSSVSIFPFGPLRRPRMRSDFQQSVTSPPRTLGVFCLNPNRFKFDIGLVNP
jgi:hypothetical protein